MTKTLTYQDAGVDIAAGNELVDRIKPALAKTNRPGIMGAIGGFGGLFDPKAAGYEDPILVSATDGVGTKLRIAFESGEHSSVGIDLVAMCVNDLIVQGAEPLFFLDYFATSRLDPEHAASVVEGIAKGCAEAGCALIGGETAELPGFYQDGEYDLAGFAVGAVERGNLLPSRSLDAGMAIIALPSSGVHSNGFSLVRKIVENAGLSWSDLAPFAGDKSLGQALLAPTKLYVKPVIGTLKAGAPIQALCHITGGGLVENIPRVLPDGIGAVLDLSDVDRPLVFDWLADTGPVSQADMALTFNCGVGMVAIVPANETDAVIRSFSDYGQPANLVGELVRTENQAQRVEVKGLPGVNSSEDH